VVAPARDAASLVVWRQDGGRTDVLMGMRVAGHRFMPNRLVFPGGAVDAADFAAPAGTPLRPEVVALMTRAATLELAHALAHAAARELFEETGLSLGAPPALDGLDYLCRAVTPEAQPIRFNARFLAVPAARVAGTLAGSGELEALRFYDLDEALGYELVNAQRITLEALRDYLAMPETARVRRESVPVFREMALGVE
jgi:8-oxo-dGTP pyrophosphatase MutT (NUDIX family)